MYIYIYIYILDSLQLFGETHISFEKCGCHQKGSGTGHGFKQV